MKLFEKIDIFYLSLNWIFIYLNLLTIKQFLILQSFYYILQLCIFRKYILHHLVVSVFFLWTPGDMDHKYLAVSTSLFQICVALLLLAKEYRSIGLFLISLFSWFSIRILGHLIFIIIWFSSFNSIELAFNIYIWLYSIYSFFHILASATRFDDGRIALLSILAWKKKCNFLWATDLEIAKQALKSSDKGSFIEEKIATPAWAPVLSLESTNGKTWKNLRDNFNQLQKILPPKEALAQSLKDVLSKRNQTIEIDSYEITRITVASFVKWIFEKDWDYSWNFVCEASFEWRKEIAVKGKADEKIKEKTIQWLTDLILDSKYANLFGEKWKDPEYYSIIMQPFILSPMINFSDICVYAKKYPEMHVCELIHTYHPFPILERYIDKDIILNGKVIISANTQVFIPLDIIGRNNIYSENIWTVFGAGPRKCLGSSYAMIFLETFLSYCKDRTDFVPSKNHRYSGRNNDRVTMKQAIYQLKVFARILF